MVVTTVQAATTSASFQWPAQGRVRLVQTAEQGHPLCKYSIPGRTLQRRSEVPLQDIHSCGTFMWHVHVLRLPSRLTCGSRCPRRHVAWLHWCRRTYRGSDHTAAVCFSPKSLLRPVGPLPMSLMVHVNARSYESKLKDSALTAGYRQHGRTVWRRHMRSATTVADAASGLLALATHALVDAAFTSVRRVVAPLAHALVAISSPVQLARQPTSKAGESWQQQARNLGARDWSDVGEVPTPPPIPTPTSHARLHTLMRDLNGSIAPDRRGGAPVRVAVAHARACVVLLTPKCAALYCAVLCCVVLWCMLYCTVVCCAMGYALLCCVVVRACLLRPNSTR